MFLLSRLWRSYLDRTIAMRRDQFSALPLPPGRTLFLGDSITEGGNWAEWFPDLLTLNRGIGGDTIEGVLTRLDTAINAPAAISLLIGTNDLTMKARQRHVPEIAAQFRSLAVEIRSRAPRALLLVSGIMPRTRRYAPLIAELNAHYVVTANEVGATFVDLRRALGNPDGTLREDCTSDALHLNGRGYEIWSRALRPFLTPSPPSDDFANEGA